MSSAPANKTNVEKKDFKKIKRMMESPITY